jgi:hypothetical protein
MVGLELLASVDMFVNYDWLKTVEELVEQSEAESWCVVLIIFHRAVSSLLYSNVGSQVTRIRASLSCACSEVLFSLYVKTSGSSWCLECALSCHGVQDNVDPMKEVEGENSEDHSLI